MASVVRLGDESSGHGCFAPTSLVTTPATKTFINGILIGLVGAEYATHSCDDTTHPQSIRTIASGSTKTFVEGYAVARLGDPISCGDVCAQGSENTFVG
jgi:uncharacterized Zn-binding protein involved in type VI secretion